MALEVNKLVTVTGYSKIEDRQAVYLSATLGAEDYGRMTVNQSIQDQETYNANRVQCRKDIQEFQNLVYEIEDQLSGTTTTTKK